MIPLPKIGTGFLSLDDGKKPSIKGLFFMKNGDLKCPIFVGKLPITGISALRSGARRASTFCGAPTTSARSGIRPATEVHHLTYERVFQEHPSDLLAVCRQCHAEIHWRQPANDNQIQFVFDFPTVDEDDEDKEGN